MEHRHEDDDIAGSVYMLILCTLRHAAEGNAAISQLLMTSGGLVGFRFRRHGRVREIGIAGSLFVGVY